LTSVRHFSYLGYNSLKDFLPTMDIKPNTGCCNNRCLEAQQAYQVGGHHFVTAVAAEIALPLPWVQPYKDRLAQRRLVMFGRDID
jgi:hypothetical protein